MRRSSAVGTCRYMSNMCLVILYFPLIKAFRTNLQYKIGSISSILTSLGHVFDLLSLSSE